MQMHVHGKPTALDGHPVLAKESPRVIQSPRWRGKGTRDMRQDELVAAHVRGLIESGKIKPGDKLPFTQAELAEILGVNKNSVFWGLATLRAEGVIIGVQGGRAVVPKSPAGSGPEPIDPDASAEDEETKEL
jgi:DNA-binding FadR family transcriptional regulator